jgi:thioredoxin-related protein
MMNDDAKVNIFLLLCNMKSFFILILVVAGSFRVSAQTTEKAKWYTLEEALKLNATAPRKILIDVYTDWCGWCKVMDAETFNHPVIARYINKHFYAVKFDAESSAPVKFGDHTFENPGSGGMRKSTHQFVTALEVRGYPAVAYFTDDLKLLGVIPGFQKPEDIEPLLHFIVEEKYKSNISFENKKKTFVSELPKK